MEWYGEEVEGRRQVCGLPPVLLDPATPAQCFRWDHRVGPLGSAEREEGNRVRAPPTILETEDSRGRWGMETFVASKRPSSTSWELDKDL